LELSEARTTTRRRRAPRGSGEQLRREIVTAARRLLTSSANADAVSIRQVADAVGVTSPSIYLHFADKNDLLSAVVVDVFADLDAAMLAAGEGLETPLERLYAYGMAYVRFAVEHPEHYRLATMDPCPRPDIDEVLSESAFAHFNEVVLQCIADGVFAGDSLAITLELWSAAHGIASLLITKPFLPWGDQEAIAGRVLRAAALGHAAGSLFEAEPSPTEVRDWVRAQRRARGRRRH
jgi:AcrR family transcriptional regulator